MSIWSHRRSGGREHRNLTPEAAIQIKGLKQKIFDLGGIFVYLVGLRQEDKIRDSRPQHERYDYRCPCGLCGESFDLPETAWSCAMRHYSYYTKQSVRDGRVLSARNNANLAVHWYNKRRQIRK